MQLGSVEHIPVSLVLSVYAGLKCDCANSESWLNEHLGLAVCEYGSVHDSYQ